MTSRIRACKAATATAALRSPSRARRPLDTTARLGLPRPLGSSVRPTSIARVDKVTKCPAPRNLAPFAGRRQALLPAPRVLRDRGVLAGLVRLSSVQQRRGLRAKEVMLLPTEPSVRKGPIAWATICCQPFARRMGDRIVRRGRTLHPGYYVRRRSTAKAAFLTRSPATQCWESRAPWARRWRLESRASLVHTAPAVQRSPNHARRPLATIAHWRAPILKGNPAPRGGTVPAGTQTSQHAAQQPRQAITAPSKAATRPARCAKQVTTALADRPP